ncbi:hypothetical protein [Cohnella algarum]|uniref:hypothetical protein n=1 Tax=Cohnella algarum TaxID=2044859 RepID=UPI0019682983|nr:hypothetical protein [Cohnella algarum]MBN2980091.1 hypothetical protein [Cohnella algarum]
MYKVPVYNNVCDRDVISRVRYNERLDRWNGSNWQNGGVGRHLGITRLQDGRFVLIYGTQWEGERDYGLIATDREALDEILRSGNDDLLEDKRFAPLKALAEKLMPEIV